MKSILKNSNGNAVSTNGKLLGKPEGVDRLKKLLDTTKSAVRLFHDYQGTRIDDLISYSDTENVTNMTEFCNGCYYLTYFPPLNTSKVTNMSYLLQNCFGLTNSIIQLDTSNVTNMAGLINGCRLLTTIDITSMDKITSIYSLASICSNCYSLTKFIVRTMTVIPPLNTNSFQSCHHFTGTVNATYNPEGLKDGRIYVPDDFVEQLKSATNWSAYADIIVPLSTLEE